MGATRTRRGIGGDEVGRRRRRPACETLETRALLTAAPAGGLLSPVSAAVARAQAVIAGGAAAEFASYQADLLRAEQASRVKPAAFATLRSDAASLAQAIAGAPLTSEAVSQQLVQLQDVLDQAFLDASDRGPQWNRVSQELGSALYGVTFTTNLPSQVVSDMKAVARQANVTAAERQRLLADERSIAAALGPNVTTALGASVPRDPVMVYFDGQVAQFVAGAERGRVQRPRR